MNRIAVVDHNWETDELATVFFECPACEFSRVPYCGLPYADLNHEEAQTRFCPGCGVRIEWVQCCGTPGASDCKDECPTRVEYMERLRR